MGIVTLIVIFGLCFISANTQTNGIVKIGSPLMLSTAGQDAEGVIFLLNEYVLKKGILFAFSAIFLKDTKMRFQIWRPVNGTDDFELIAEVKFKASVLKIREDVYIESRIIEKCILLNEDDRIGIYFEEAPSAVPYTFTSANAFTLHHTMPNASVPTAIGEKVKFNKLNWPYDFPVQAFIDTQLEYYANDTENPGFVTCKPGLLIPDFDVMTMSTTTPVPITGAPGDTGATGPVGGLGDTGATGPMGAEGANGTMGATGATGGIGATGSVGMSGDTGSTGPMGGMGATGSIGAKGDKGDAGIQGPPGPSGPGGTYSPIAAPLADKTWMEEPMLVLILLIWLLVVTIVLVIVSVIMCCCCVCKSKEVNDNKYQHNNGYDNSVAMNSAAYEKKYNYNEDIETGEELPAPNIARHDDKRVSTVSYLEGQPSWVNTMKSTSESVMSNNTIEEDEKPPSINGNLAISDIDVQEKDGMNEGGSHYGSQTILNSGLPDDGRTEF